MATVADPTWVEVDPMGHEHRFLGESVPTLDENHRCRRCGHQAKPNFLEEIIPAGVFDSIVDIQIEMKRDADAFVGEAGTIVSLPGRVSAILHVRTITGEFRDVGLDELEIKEAEKYLADMDGLRTFAKWVFARRGIVL